MVDDFLPVDRQKKRKKVAKALHVADAQLLDELAGDSSADISVPKNTAKIEPIVRVPEPILEAEPNILADEPAVSNDIEGAEPEDEKRFLGLIWPLNKQQKIIGSVAAIVLAIGIGAGWTLTHHKRAVVAIAIPKHTAVAAKPFTPMYSTLSGLQIADASVNQKPVTAAMIENSVDARPQAGLSQAGVVFEAVAEGGVTRFMALFQDQTPANIGPIRSARPYYVSWSLGFDAPYAHVGGSPDALNDITSWHVKDLNQFYNGDSYHRVSSRAAPHNVYTGVDTLNKLESSKGFTTSTYTGFIRKNDAASKAPAATSIDFSLSGYTYDPHYDYDAAANSYKRSEAGEAQTDANTGKQLEPKVVIAIVVPLSQGALDASGAYYSNYNVIGSGQATIFQDGTAMQATWTKPDNTTNISFTDASGNPIALNRGQTWISAVTDPSKVSYK